MPISFALAGFDFRGEPRRDFGLEGLAVLDLDLPRDASVTVAGAAIDSHGRILIAGTVDGELAVARILADATPDVAFGRSGLATVDFVSSTTEYAAGIAIDGSDQVYVAASATVDGHGEFAVARLLTDGRLDRRFGGDGKVLTRFFSADTVWATDVALDPFDRPVVVGVARFEDRSEIALARYTSDGSLDSTFDGDGKVLTNFFSFRWEGAAAVAIDERGRVVTCGGSGERNTGQIVVTRHLPDGRLDASFNADGKVVTDFASSVDEHADSVAVDARGRIVVAGYARPDGGSQVLLARYTEDGRLDPALDGDGKAYVGDPLHYGTDIGLVPSVQGLLYAAGVWGPLTLALDPVANVLVKSELGLVRSTDLGSRDPGFGEDGLVVFARSGIQMNGRGTGLVVSPSGEPTVAFAAVTAP